MQNIKFKSRQRPAFSRTQAGGRQNRQLQNQNNHFANLSQNQENFLRIIPLGGLGEVGRNMLVLEYQGKYLIIDAGFRMPEEDMPGVDYLIPNTAFLKNKQKYILGTVITHGHYDHIGAIPYTWPRLGNPKIFAPGLAKGIILKRQEEFPFQKKLDITEIKDGSRITLGPFQIEFFRQNHNIPDNYGLFIKTPVGNLVHTSDFKFDRSPINDLPTDFKRLKSIAKQGVLLLLSDSTGAENEGRSLSEKTIFRNLEQIFRESKGRIITSTFASHINRVQQIIALAERYHRKVILEGFSMKGNVEIAVNLNYIKAQKGTLVKPDAINKLADNQVCFLCTGAQGEEGAVLMRLANGDYRHFQLKKGDAVIFSSSVIPGNERSVQFLKDQFYRQGAKVFHYQMLDIHASGHAYQEELLEMIRIMRPKFFVPLHGQYSMLTMHAELAEKAGLKKRQIKVIENGQVLDLSAQKMLLERKGVSAGYVMVDGLGIGDVGEVVLRDRQTLSKDGMFVIVVIVDKQAGQVKGSPDIISRGFVYLRESKELLQQTRQKVVEIVNNNVKQKKTINYVYLKEELRNRIGEFLFKKIQRRPMVLPVIIQV